MNWKDELKKDLLIEEAFDLTHLDKVFKKHMWTNGNRIFLRTVNSKVKAEVMTGRYVNQLSFCDLKYKKAIAVGKDQLIECNSEDFPLNIKLDMVKFDNKVLRNIEHLLRTRVQFNSFVDVNWNCDEGRILFVIYEEEYSN